MPPSQSRLKTALSSPAPADFLQLRAWSAISESGAAPPVQRVKALRLLTSCSSAPTGAHVACGVREGGTARPGRAGWRSRGARSGAVPPSQGRLKTARCGLAPTDFLRLHARRCAPRPRSAGAAHSAPCMSRTERSRGTRRGAAPPSQGRLKTARSGLVLADFLWLHARRHPRGPRSPRAAHSAPCASRAERLRHKVQRSTAKPGSAQNGARRPCAP